MTKSPQPPGSGLSTTEVKQLYLQGKKKRQRQAACRTIRAGRRRPGSNNENQRI
jgi:hypothetical protein